MGHKVYTYKYGPTGDHSFGYNWEDAAIIIIQNNPVIHNILFKRVSSSKTELEATRDGRSVQHISLRCSDRGVLAANQRRIQKNVSTSLYDSLANGASYSQHLQYVSSSEVSDNLSLCHHLQNLIKFQDLNSSDGNRYFISNIQI